MCIGNSTHKVISEEHVTRADDAHRDMNFSEQVAYTTILITIFHSQGDPSECTSMPMNSYVNKIYQR